MQISTYTFKAITQVSLLVKKVNEDYDSIEFLSQEFKNKNVFIDGYTYIVAKSAGLKIITDYDTMIHLSDINNYNISRLKNVINNQVYDLFFLESNQCKYKDRKICKIDQDFFVYNHVNLPNHLKGKLFLQRKNNKK